MKRTLCVLKQEEAPAPEGKQEVRMDQEMLLSRLQKEHAVIFGTGFVARMFWHALLQHRLEGRITAFLESDPRPGRTYQGLPVISAFSDAADHNSLVCLAVHESIAGEMKEKLQDAGFSCVVWIAPLLCDLLYGPPLAAGLVDVNEILDSQDPDENWIALRYGAMRDYYRQTADYAFAGEVYCRAIALHCGYETAKKRALAMERLADSVKQNGFDPEHPVCIDENKCIIDGLHRFAAAVCCGIRQIPCIIYHASPVYSTLLDDRNRLPDRILAEADLPEGGYAWLRQAKEELFAMADAGPDLTEKTKADPAVSVIVPVYNVEGYIDVCMESIVSQTLRDFEVLLINDGSDDGSPEKCRAWAARDPRIRLFDRENGGVAKARNFGVSEARGKYLAFVDPDDWLDPRYLELLYERLESSGSAFAECDLWRYDNRTGRKIYRSCSGRMGQPYTFREHMKYGPTATYKSMSRRDLWLKYSIHMPDCAFESPAIYSLVLALSGHVESVPEALYYYRRFRENSLIETGYAAKDGTPNNTLGTEAMEFLLSEFKRCGLYEEFSDTLPGVVTYRLSDILATQFHRKNTADYREVVRNYRGFLKRAFPGKAYPVYITWGGYNLNRILTHMNILHDPYCRFNFSSLISIAGEQPAADPFLHRNRYRNIMLERERQQSFWNILEETGPSLLFMDLLEERFDMVPAGNGWITGSDAYEGREQGGPRIPRGKEPACGTKSAGTAGNSGLREGASGLLLRESGESTGVLPRESGESTGLLPRDSEECTGLFRKSAEAFRQRVLQTVPRIRLVLIENYLSEKAGDLKKQTCFDDLCGIRRTNRILRTYYGFMEELWPEALIIRPEGRELYFTDSRYEYGAVPSHLNEIVNQQIAEEIEELLRRSL